MKNFYIKVGEIMLFFGMLLLSQNALSQMAVTGKVTSADSPEGLPGVNVMVKGTNQGTVTDVSGNYSINVPSGDAILVFSSVGYLSHDEVVSNQNTINISLRVDVTALEEVVVVGYGTQKKSDLTGSVVSADLEAFQEAPNVNIMQSLQGSIPGVQIGQVNRPGQEPAIGVRGRTSISGSLSPLIVVDGIIFRGRVADLNPADIQSVDILKDASSMAIYGAQAANGVIIITTKGGKTSRKPTLTYNTSIATQNPTTNARLLNRDEFLQKVRDIEYKNAYLPPDYRQPNPNWTFDQSELLPPVRQGVDDGTDFDWYDAMTSTGYIMDHNLAVSGGSENTSYYVSAGYTKQRGFVLNDNYKRSTVRINLETDITDWLTIGTNTFGSFTDFSGVVPSLGTLTRTTPLVTPFDENGNLVINHLGDNQVNPFLSAQADDRELKNRLSGIFYGIIKFPGIEGLTYRVNFSNTLNWFEDARSDIYGAGFTGTAFKAHARNLDVMLDNIITYDKQFNDHSINATLLYGYNTIEFNRTVARGENIPNLTLSYNNLEQAIIREIESGAWEEALLYQMARLNYKYKDKYMVTGTLRRDGFSGFSRNNKTAIFPSIGAGWVLTEENFVNIPKLDYLKFRASYGVNGNQTARYSSLARVEATDASRYVFGDGGSSSPGQSVASLANDDLAWERTVGFNFGLDFGLFNNRIGGNIEYYSTTTTDLLWNMVIPRMTGFSQITTNIGEVANRGLEFAINGRAIEKQDFSWSMSLNFATNDNEIVSLLGLDRDGDGREDDLVANNLFIGRSLGAIFNYEIDGIWQVDDDIPSGFNPGNYRIIDQNGDGVITPEDDRVFLGRSEPAFFMGFQNTMRYKRFTFRFFLNSIQGGRDGYLGAIASAGPGTTGTAQNANWFNTYDFWSPNNRDARYSVTWMPGQQNPPQYFSRSFVRLQDISLAYQLHDAIAQRIGVQGLKLFVSGKNLLTITNWDGFDPETGQGIAAGQAFPVMKAYTLGLDISF